MDGYLVISSPFFHGNDLESSLNINGERTQSHGGLVQMIFLFNWLMFRFQPLIFRGFSQHLPKGAVFQGSSLKSMVGPSSSLPKTNMDNLGVAPLPVTVTTRIITFLVGDPYKPSFATVTGRGDNPMDN